MKRVIFLLAIVLAASCQKDESVAPHPTTGSAKASTDIKLNLPDTPYAYNLHWTSDNIATLGRVLFYDTRLSMDNTISCASCHKQSLMFSDNVAFSAGVGNHQTIRNTLPIQNIGSPMNYTNLIKPVLFWDGRERDLNEMVLLPIQNHNEMGYNLDSLIVKISQFPEYHKLFQKAFFFNDIVTKEGIGQALGAFVMSIRSNNSIFDKHLAGIPGQLTDQELMGFSLFKTTYNCDNCHHVEESISQAGEGFTSGIDYNGSVSFANPVTARFSNIGLDVTSLDPGLQAVTTADSDQAKFRIPSLRNIALTAPYMHDGRYKTLEEVIDHYSHNIEDSKTLDQNLRDPVSGHPKQFNISDADAKAIIAFLKTLTDDSATKDVKFSSPFVAQ